ncbi:MAG: hypothetical protein GDA49_10710 [Rhodospirillales bacterium]|nr:hypothetical protein [Rhodospirillales bacterium]
MRAACATTASCSCSTIWRPSPPKTQGVFELKLGDAAPGEAVPVFLAILKERFAGRFWIDSFSHRLLHEVHKSDPEVPISIHTEFACKRSLLNPAPYRPILGYRLTAVGAQAVRASCKRLLLSRLYKPAVMAFAQV